MVASLLDRFGAVGPLMLWTRVKGPQRAVARTRRHPVGLELMVTIDGEQFWAQTFSPELVEPLMESTATAQQRCCWPMGGSQPGRKRSMTRLTEIL